MTANLGNIDVSNVEATQAFDVLPAGWYNVQIVESDMKPTKDGKGQYLQIVEQVLDGPHKGRKIYDRLNLVNDNRTAVDIAYKTLKAIYTACGKVRVNDSGELHGIPHKVKVKIRPADGKYEASNDASAYDTAASAHEVVTQGPAAPVASAFAGGTPPWAAGQAAQPAPAVAPTQPAQPMAPAFVPPAGGQPWAQPATATPAAQPATPAHVMTAKANGASYEDFTAQGWTDAQLIENGYMEAPVTAAPVTPPVPATPAAPTAPAAPVPATQAPGGPVPPWAR